MNSVTRQLFFFCFTTFEICCGGYYRMSNIFDRIKMYTKITTNTTNFNCIAYKQPSTIYTEEKKEQ